MNEFMYYTFLHAPGIFDMVFYCLLFLIGALAAMIFGSLRWWWIKRTRLPEMWRRQRKEYEKQIEDLSNYADRLLEENNRLRTVAHGRLHMTFESALIKDKDP
jgi:hypothetical protein